jgi:hypothetical protein
LESGGLTDHRDRIEKLFRKLPALWLLGKSEAYEGAQGPGPWGLLFL